MAQMENNGQGTIFIRGPTPLLQAQVTTVWSHTTTAWEVVLEPQWKTTYWAQCLLRYYPLKSNSVVLIYKGLPLLDTAGSP